MSEDNWVNDKEGASYLENDDGVECAWQCSRGHRIGQNEYINNECIVCEDEWQEKMRNGE
jgi:hypothetical protein